MGLLLGSWTFRGHPGLSPAGPPQDRVDRTPESSTEGRERAVFVHLLLSPPLGAWVFWPLPELLGVALAQPSLPGFLCLPVS